MFFKMLAFEWRYFTKQPSFIVTSLVFFLFPFLAMTVENVQIGSGGNVMFNSPSAIATVMLILGVFAMFLVVNFVANTASRNDSAHMAEIICTKPISPLSYQLGRFFGAYLVTLTVFAMVPLGSFVGSLMPWLDADRIGPNHLNHYLMPFVVFSATTLFVLSTIFYAVALRFRSVMAVYLAALGLFMAYVISGAIFDEPQQRFWLSLMDPFGLRTYTDVTRYWTTFEKNTLVVGWELAVLQNRLLWLGVGVFCLFVLGNIFKPLSIAQNRNKPAKKTKLDSAPPMHNTITAKYNEGATWLQFTTRLRFEVKQIVLSPAFPILMLFCTFQLVAQLVANSGGLYGAADWPLTQTMVELIINAFSLVMIIVITYYSAEVVWRERSVGLGDITDSMPVSNMTIWLSKLLAVNVVIICVCLLGMLATITNQVIKGFEDINLFQYVVSIFYFNASSFILLTFLAFFIQTLSPNKYVGMLIFVGYFFVSLVFSQLGVEHNMFNYAASPVLNYSDMNGYGWYMTTQNWYLLYWSALAVCLSVLSYGLWQRGPDTSVLSRLHNISYQIGNPGKVTLLLSVILFTVVGGVIHYNTTVVNTFYSSEQALDRQAEYEKRYAQYEDSPVPIAISVDADVAIFPAQRRVETITNVVFENHSEQAISRFLINYPQHSPQVAIDIDGGAVQEMEEEFKVAWFEFSEPMLPNERRNATIKVVREHTGFKDRGEDNTVVQNGTFINNFQLYPSFGVDQGYYISDRHERKKRELGPPKRAYLLEDESRYHETFFGPQVTQIDFSATISTSAEQYAIAPGYLQKEWEQDGRRYFRYEMDSPMLNFFSIMSAKLAVKKERYKGIDIAVYYHPQHAWNIDRMIESCKDSIDYFSREFGPYQHKQLRIIEFPGYRRFAQSFANTVPYSERIGFISDLRDKSEIDPVYYVTAHEVAHQWFGHQLSPANVQGSAILSESLSQYAALLVMQAKYGEEKIRKFLSYELDSYLRARGSEELEEMPMLRSENQSYIHYRKGSVVMMALKDRMGELALNQALAGLIEKFRFSTGPQATTLDLVAALKKYAPANVHAFIDQQFEQITLFEFVLDESSVEPASSDAEQWLVELQISAKQFVATGKGEEREQAFSDEVDIVLFSADPNKFDADIEILYRQKHLLVSGENTINIEVDEKPAYAGVDPFVRYIDRDSKNNIKQL